MKQTNYDTMTEDELGEARIALDEQIAALRAKKKAIQNVVDRRRAAERADQGSVTISGAGGIESEELVGKV